MRGEPARHPHPSWWTAAEPLPRLVVERTPVSPVARSTGDTGSLVWHDNEGRICARGYVDGVDRWMELPGIGGFRFQPGGDEVHAFVRPDLDGALIEDAYRRTVLPMALQVSGRDVLHASAVLSEAGVIGLCAVSETGKSTLARGLAGRGYRLWGDDALPFSLDGSAASALSLPFSLRLRPESVRFFGDKHDDVDPGGEHARLRCLFVLERSPSGERPTAVHAAPADAFGLLLAHAYCFDLDDPDLKRKMLRNYLGLVERVPAYVLRFPSGLESLDSSLDELERAIGETA